MNIDAIPLAMRKAKRWLVWDYQHRGADKPTKKPSYIDGKPRKGPLDSAEDLARLATFERALEASREHSGLGFALGPDDSGNCWQGIDLDDLEGAGRDAVIETLPGYVERSPSRRGLHAIGYGAPFKPLGSNQSGIEAYSEKRFFTVTGDTPRGEITCLANFVHLHLVPLHQRTLHRDTEAQIHRDSDTQIPRSSEIQDIHAIGGDIDWLPTNCRPTKTRERNRVLFNLARHLKTLYPDCDCNDLIGLVKEWHKEYLTTIGTKDWMETWADFSYAWDRVRCLEDEGVLHKTYQETASGLSVPVSLAQIGFDEPLFRVAEFCRRLSLHNNGVFFLSCRSLGRLLDKSPVTANKVLTFLTRNGLLKVVEEGRLATPNGPQATTYKFIGWDEPSANCRDDKETTPG